ncbi:transglutaminase-like domain-containing protein [Brachybacterium phenoliresistens]|uniref:transglutaminase-like domain-containing protein n=1 Tax=Brachybacterium phenoliresistens TaxID=396014 RepID=UPI0031D2A82C
MREDTTFFETRGHGPRAVDIAVMAVLFLLAVLGLQDAYGGADYLLAGVMALAVGTIVALVGARWRWGVLRVTLATLVLHLLLGSTFAAPTHALFHVIPTLASLRELLVAPITAWKAMLTVSTPVGSAHGVLGVVWISTLLLSVAGMSIVLRTRRYALAWLFPLALLLVSVAFGTSAAVAPMLRGIGVAVISLAWLTWRFESARLASARSTIISDTVRPGSWRNPVLRRRVIGGGLVLVIACGATAGAQALLDPPPGTARFALRDTMTPPFDPDEYVSPLTEFRGYLKHQREAELFTVTGVEDGELVRLATLDRYDLQTFAVASSTERTGPSGAFLRTATGVDLHEASPAARTATVTIGEYRGVWMPTLGSRTDRIDALGEGGDLAENLYLNQVSQTAVDASVLGSGESYDLVYEPYRHPTAQEQDEMEFADIDLPPLPENLPAEYKELAEAAVGDTDDDYAKMQNLSATMQSTGYFSHGVDPEDTLSLPGHGASRLNAMLAEEISYDAEDVTAMPQGRIGDQEQYAALTVVLARSVGIPARVVMGFEVPAGSAGEATITGDDVTAWVEVAYEGQGWVRFDPTPEQDDTPTQPEKNKVEKPRPQVAQPPPPPAEPPSPPPGATSEDAPGEEEDPAQTSSWAVYAAAGSGPFLLLGALLAAIALAKARRRAHRRTRGSAAERIDGGWQELLDVRADLGRPADVLVTRRELAAEIEAELPGAGIAVLAERADRGVFGPEEMPQAAVDEYWAQVMDSRAALLAAVPWHRRLLGRFSLRSFRRRRALRRAAARDRQRLDARRESSRAQAEQRAARRGRGVPEPAQPRGIGRLLDRIGAAIPRGRTRIPRTTSTTSTTRSTQEDR